ncbi:alpha/beta-hydrolase [Acephala macrosclerotiorum]|nr:alpha/beta-hydrolase [Acephala macrosclerotiorum]
MAPSILRFLFLSFSCLSLVASVISQRYGHKIHGKGRAATKLDVNARQKPCPVADRSTKSLRFLDDTTKRFRVASLPDVDFDIGEMYSGLIPINMSDPSRAFLFVYQPTVGTPVDEVTIWLNGGLGCSSLEGSFQENVRLLWSAGSFAPIHNPYSWVSLTNVLWVDQPKTFSIKKFKIFVTGESYAGRYVPYIASAMNDRHDTDYFNLQGAMTYDPTIGSFDYVQEMAVAAPFIHANNAMMNLNSPFLAELDFIDQACGYADFRNTYMTFLHLQDINQRNTSITQQTSDVTFDFAVTAAVAINPCFNPYHIPDTCPMLPSVLGFSGILEVTTPGLPIYFDRADVKKAMDVPPNLGRVICTSTPVLLAPYGQGPEQNPGGGISAHPIQHVLPKLAIQNMTWNGKLGFQSRPATPIFITLPDLEYEAGMMGVQHFERGLMWAETLRSVHEQPVGSGG